MYLKKLKIDGKFKINNFKYQYGPWVIVAGASEGLGADFAPIGSFEDRTEEDLLKIIDVNIKAPLIMV